MLSFTFIKRGKFVMHTIKNILYVTPDDLSNDAIVNKVLGFANKKQAKITFLRVIKKVPKEMAAIIKRYQKVDLAKSLEKENIAEIEQSLKNTKVKGADYEIKVLVGDKYALTVKELQQKRYDLLVLSDYDGRRKLAERFFGSKHLFLLRNAPNPVMVFRPGKKKQKYRMLIALDTEDMSVEKQNFNRKILDYALATSVFDDVEIDIVSCWQLYGESSLRDGFIQVPREKLNAMLKETKTHYQQVFDEALEHLDIEEGISTHLLKGSPTQVIPQYAKKNHIDMVVLGTVSRSGMPGITIGNTAEDILQRVDCSILMVKPDRL